MRFDFSVSPSPPRTSGQRIAAFVALLFCVCSALFAMWIAVAGPRISGGLSLLPDAANQMLGRLVFGASSVMLLGLAWLAARDVRATPKQDAEVDRHNRRV